MTPYTAGHPIPINGELVRVICQPELSHQEENFFVQHQLKPSVVSRAKQLVLTPPCYLCYSSRLTLAQLADPTVRRHKPALNIFVLFIDNVSRAGIHRNLPRLIQWLEQTQEPAPFARRPTARLYPFLRYHVIGRHSFPNITPMFRGHDGGYITENVARQHFWWQPYASAGYATLWTVQECTDYFGKYWDTASAAVDVDADSSSAYCHGDYGMVAKGNRCICQRYAYENMLDYYEQFRRDYRGVGVPTVATLLLMDAHDDSTGASVEIIDHALVQFLQRMADDGALNDTAIVIVSDHGPKHGMYFKLSSAGNVEQRMPFLAMLLPAWFVEDMHPEISENLKHNMQRLITAFDIHETLTHFLAYPERVKNNAVRQSRPPDGAYSLLADKVPTNRTCHDAGIPKPICTCGWFGSWGDAFIDAYKDFWTWWGYDMKDHLPIR